MVYAIVSIGILGFIVWSQDGSFILEEIRKRLNYMSGKSLESEEKFVEGMYLYVTRKGKKTLSALKKQSMLTGYELNRYLGSPEKVFIHFLAKLPVNKLCLFKVVTSLGCNTPEGYARNKLRKNFELDDQQETLPKNETLLNEEKESEKKTEVRGDRSDRYEGDKDGGTHLNSDENRNKKSGIVRKTENPAISEIVRTTPENVFIHFLVTSLENPAIAWGAIEGRRKDNEVVRVKEGSSETKCSISDCSWLIGFFEAEGCVTKEKRLVITQKDKRILWRIRGILGEGSVTGNNLVISKREEVKRLGERIAKEVRLRSTEGKLRRLEGLIEVEGKKERKEINLSDGWLSGFIEGDGGFNVEMRKDERYRMGYRVRTRIYIVQKGEEEGMSKIARLIGGNMERRGGYNRVVMTSIRGAIRMRDYLRKNPLRTIKRIEMMRWMKVVDMMEKGEHLTTRIGKIREIKNRMNKR